MSVAPARRSAMSHLGAVERGRPGDARAALVEQLDIGAHLHELAGVVDAVLEDRLVDRRDAVAPGSAGRKAAPGSRWRSPDTDPCGRRPPAARRQSAAPGGGGRGIGLVGDPDPVADLEEGTEVLGSDAGERHVATRDGGGDGERLGLEPIADDHVLGARTAARRPRSRSGARRCARCAPPSSRALRSGRQLPARARRCRSPSSRAPAWPQASHSRCPSR